MRRIFLVVSVLGLLSVMALPAMAQGWGDQGEQGNNWWGGQGNNWGEQGNNWGDQGNNWGRDSGYCEGWQKDWHRNDNGYWWYWWYRWCWSPRYEWYQDWGGWDWG